MKLLCVVFITVKVKDKFVLFYDLRHIDYFYEKVKSLINIEFPIIGLKLENLNFKIIFFWAQPSPLRLRKHINNSVGSGRAVHYIFAARTFSFHISNFRLAAKDAIPIPCAN